MTKTMFRFIDMKDGRVAVVDKSNNKVPAVEIVASRQSLINQVFGGVE